MNPALSTKKRLRVVRKSGMKLFLIRHAESIWNRKQRIQGRQDPGLSENGKRQAKALAKRLRKEHIQIIYASGLKRCSQTAKVISKETKAPIKFLPELEEIILGDWQGKTVEQVKSEYPKVYEDWLNAPSKAKIPGWEGIPRFIKRVNNAFEYILNSDSATCPTTPRLGRASPSKRRRRRNSICVVTHWGVIAAYFSKVLNTSFDWFFKTVRIDNGGINKITYQNGNVVVQYINDTRYLPKWN